MKIQLSNMQAQRMMGALQIIDNNEAVRLPGLVRLDIARNINRLMTNVSSFERALIGKRREMKKPDDSPENAAIANEMDAMGDKVEDYDLYEIAHDQLRLDDNPRITGTMIAALAPILKDFDSLAKAAKPPIKAA